MKYYIDPDEDPDLTKQDLIYHGLTDYQATAVVAQTKLAAGQIAKFEAFRSKSSLTPQQYAELKVLLNL